MGLGKRNRPYPRIGFGRQRARRSDYLWRRRMAWEYGRRGPAKLARVPWSLFVIAIGFMILSWLLH